jgi:two-component system response regulator GlrR
VIDDLESLATPVRAQLIDHLKKTSENPSGPQTEQSPRMIITSGLAPSLSDIRFAGIRLTSLQERTECILPLSAHFLGLFAAEAGTEPIGFTADARRWLLEEPWHGNIRELGERVRQAVALSGTGAISAEALLLAADGDDMLSFKEAKRAFETRYVECLLRRCRGNISRAARLARKDRKDFYDVIRRTGIEPAQFRS